MGRIELRQSLTGSSPGPNASSSVTPAPHRLTPLRLNAYEGRNCSKRDSTL